MAGSRNRTSRPMADEKSVDAEAAEIKREVAKEHSRQLNSVSETTPFRQAPRSEAVLINNLRY
jgi:hypothetical protein